MNLERVNSLWQSALLLLRTQTQTLKVCYSIWIGIQYRLAQTFRTVSILCAKVLVGAVTLTVVFQLPLVLLIHNYLDRRKA